MPSYACPCLDSQSEHHVPQIRVMRRGGIVVMLNSGLRVSQNMVFLLDKLIEVLH